MLVLGITIRQASEGHDRDSVLLPQIQLDLAGNVSAAAAARGKPTIVGLVSGGGLDVSTLQSNPNISVRTSSFCALNFLVDNDELPKTG